MRFFEATEIFQFFLEDKFGDSKVNGRGHLVFISDKRIPQFSFASEIYHFEVYKSVEEVCIVYACFVGESNFFIRTRVSGKIHFHFTRRTNF